MSKLMNERPALTNNQRYAIDLGLALHVVLLTLFYATLNWFSTLLKFTPPIIEWIFIGWIRLCVFSACLTFGARLTVVFDYFGRKSYRTSLTIITAWLLTLVSLVTYQSSNLKLLLFELLFWIAVLIVSQFASSPFLPMFVPKGFSDSKQFKQSSSGFQYTLSDLLIACTVLSIILGVTRTTLVMIPEQKEFEVDSEVFQLMLYPALLFFGVAGAMTLGFWRLAMNQMRYSLVIIFCCIASCFVIWLGKPTVDNRHSEIGEKIFIVMLFFSAITPAVLWNGAFCLIMKSMRYFLFEREEDLNPPKPPPKRTLRRLPTSVNFSADSETSKGEADES